MTDLSGLSDFAGDELTAAQVQGILTQIDLDITNLLRDGKLAALKYTVPGEGGRTADRAANLTALLEARKHYQQLLESFPAWEISRADDCGEQP